MRCAALSHEQVAVGRFGVREPAESVAGDLIVVIDAGKADDLPRFRIANGIEAEFGHVSGVGEIGLGIPVSILSKGGIARLLVATSIVGGDDVQPRINDLGNPCIVVYFKSAVVSINEDFHTVIFPGRSIFELGSALSLTIQSSVTSTPT